MTHDDWARVRGGVTVSLKCHTVGGERIELHSPQSLNMRSFALAKYPRTWRSSRCSCGAYPYVEHWLVIIAGIGDCQWVLPQCRAGVEPHATCWDKGILVDFHWGMKEGKGQKVFTIGDNKSHHFWQVTVQRNQVPKPTKVTFTHPSHVTCA